MVLKDLFEKYKKEQCKNCINKDKDLCEIRIINTLNNVILTRCVYYERSKENEVDKTKCRTIHKDC